MIMVVGVILSAFMRAETFVVNKKKPQKQSMNKLKEHYGDELAELIRIIPGLQKQLADLQERLINELDALLDDSMQISKIELDSRTCQAQELRCFLENEISCSLPTKSAFVKLTSSAEKKNQTAKEPAIAQ